MLPVWELAAADLHDYAALWIPRESNQNVLLRQRDKLTAYLQSGGIIVCFDEVNQPWLPSGQRGLREADLAGIRLSPHPITRQLTPELVRWHSHGAYDVAEPAQVLIDDGQGNVMLFVDERSFPGKLLAGTLDPDCHAGFGTEVTRPLLRAILSWVDSMASGVPASPGVAPVAAGSGI